MKRPSREVLERLTAIEARYKEAGLFLDVHDALYYEAVVWERGLYWDDGGRERLLLEWMPHKAREVRAWFAKPVTAKEQAFREQRYKTMKAVEALEPDDGQADEGPSWIESYVPAGFPGLTGGGPGNRRHGSRAG